MRRLITAAFVLAALSLAPLVLAQKDASSADKYVRAPQVYAELAKAPEKSRSKANPFEKNPEAIAAGHNLFDRHCSECHGDTAEGSKKAPSLRAEEVQNATSGAIFWILTNGVVRRGMPVWSKLPELQRWQLVAFIKSLGISPVNSPQTKSR
jgi:mono/diheme cytochrome c family protein